MRYPWLMPALAAGLLLSASSLALASPIIDTGGNMAAPLASGNISNGVQSGVPVIGSSANNTGGSVHHGPMGHAGADRHR
jgi:hypothetical protein